MIKKRWITSNEAAAILGLKPGTLRVWRSLCPSRLPFYRIGHHVRYDIREVEAYREERYTPRRIGGEEEG